MPAGGADDVEVRCGGRGDGGSCGVPSGGHLPCHSSGDLRGKGNANADPLRG
jgi:hypothetical protein